MTRSPKKTNAPVVVPTMPLPLSAKCPLAGRRCMRRSLVAGIYCILRSVTLRIPLTVVVVFVSLLLQSSSTFLVHSTGRKSLQQQRWPSAIVPGGAGHRLADLIAELIPQTQLGPSTFCPSQSIQILLRTLHGSAVRTTVCCNQWEKKEKKREEDWCHRSTIED